ncbi:hypothetical protein ENBRE01_2047 [Enteropsectra breve]|nr:hypothetical protein ENBRE01_2047 [Enteropsectra breve]
MAMDDKGEEEAVMYTLQAFVGSYVNEIELSDRKRANIQILLELADESFYDLCRDIQNEIRRKRGESHQKKEGAVYDNLKHLDEKKFKDLVVEILLVYNYRNPRSSSHRMGDFVTSLEKIVGDLKIESAKKNFMAKIETLDFLHAMLEYNSFVSSTGAIDEGVVSLIEGMIRSEVEKRSTNFIEALSYPTQFLDKLEEMKIVDGDEYTFHKTNIEKILKNSNMLVKLPKAHDHIVKNEMMQILGMILRGKTATAQPMDNYYPEIRIVVGVLNEIKEDINGRQNIDLEIISRKLRAVIEATIGKASIEEIDKECLNNLHIYKFMLEGLKDSASKHDAFDMVISFSKELEKFCSHARI